VGKVAVCHATVGAIVVCLVASAHASNTNSLVCLQRAHSTSVSVQRQFQRDLQRLVESKRPDLTGVAAAGVATQMAYFDVIEARFAYLVKTQPKRIEGVIGPNGAAVVFDWSDADTVALLRANPRYEQIEVKWVHLKTQTERHPDRSHLLNYIQSSQDFRALSMRFVREHRVVKDILEQCRAH
jgi:MFS superfamily sulfate permease-like transporter